MSLAFTDEIGSGFKYWGEKKKKKVSVQDPNFKARFQASVSDKHFISTVLHAKH